MYSYCLSLFFVKPPIHKNYKSNDILTLYKLNRADRKQTQKLIFMQILAMTVLSRNKTNDMKYNII